jgi:hypothetical protein
MENLKTANQIKSEFELLASGHYQIHSFIYDQEPNQFGYENIIYPCLLVSPLNGTINGTDFIRNYRIAIADRVLKSEGNKIEVESDSQLIITDILAYWMKLGQNERFTISNTATLTPFYDIWGDDVTGHYLDFGIQEFFDFNSCAIPLSSAIPSPTNPCKDARILINSVVYGNAPSDTNFNVVVKDQLGALVGSLIGGEWVVNTGGGSCPDASYTIEDSLGNVLYTGTIPSGGSVTEVISNSTLNVNKSDGTLISSRSILAEDTDSYNVGDSSAVLKDEDGNVLSTTSIKATESEDIVAPNGDVSVNSVAFDDVLSGGTLNIEVLKSTGNDQIGSKQGQYWRIGDSKITNFDSSYDVDVKATESLSLPDSQINVNGVDEGDVVSVKTIDVNLEDSLGAPVVPTSVGLVGNTLTIEVPSSAPPSTGDFLVRFFDIDGTILKEEWVDTGLDATAPTDPDYDPTYLTFDGWNNDFTNIQHDLDVGAIYDTIDGKTYLFLRITNTTGLQPTLAFNKADTNTLTIDWGDTTSDTTSSNGNINITKTTAYSAIGDYIVTLDCLGIYSSRITVGLFNSSIPYANSLLKAYMGVNMRTFTGCFLNCINMNVVSVNKDITSGFNNFAQNSGIVHINLPTGLTSVENSFISCRKLITISLNELCVNISAAFNGCSSLEKVVINNITNIGTTNTFNGCSSLRKISIPNSINSLGTFIFQNCTGLQTMLISNTLTSLGSSSIRNCNNLVELEFPNTLTSIAANSLQDNLSILEYTFLSTTPPTLANINAFTNINAACKIYVPDASVAAYQAATNWVTYANYIYPLSTKP